MGFVCLRVAVILSFMAWCVYVFSGLDAVYVFIGLLLFACCFIVLVLLFCGSPRIWVLVGSCVTFLIDAG